MAQVITVFRNRLVDGARGEYSDVAAEMSRLARTMPGYVEHKAFTADDGERVTIVTFADRASHDAWRDHPEHRAAQAAGIDRFYAEYAIQVADVTYSHRFAHGG
ncbi:MAG: antibiotic biosynthesis monooxygenase family protein [Ilumatobacteraceae bacterium]